MNMERNKCAQTHKNKQKGCKKEIEGENKSENMKEMSDKKLQPPTVL